MRRPVSDHSAFSPEPTNPMSHNELAAVAGITDLDTLVLACLRTLVAASPIQQRIGQLSIDNVANRFVGFKAVARR